MVEEDFLNVDNPIPGQNYCCLSFVSPEKILKQKEPYFIHNFLKSVSEKYNLNEKTVAEEYDNYIYQNREKLEKDFYEENDFQTSVRGIKIRGTYDTKREAEVRAKVLQRKDKNHHVFVGQVGYWLPWDPEADDIEDQQYTESELNTLVKNYNENKKKRDTFFEQQKEDHLKEIDESNKKNKENVRESETDDIEEVIKNDENKLNEESIKISDKLYEADDPWLQQKMKEGKVLDLDALEK